MNLLKNKFVQAIGVAAIAYLLFQALAWAMEAILRIAETFSQWYRFTAVPWAEEAAIAIGVIYFIIAAVVNSRSD
jgi:hypothetical protein